MSGYWEKAEAAARSAQLLLAAGDTDGAVNRAYYAMLDAAKAALEAVDPEAAKARRLGTIRRFGEYVVKPGHVDNELGRYFNETEELRRAADYETGLTGVPEAIATVERLKEFLASVARFLETRGS